MMFLLLACSSVTLNDSDVPPCVAACDALYIDCVAAGVYYSTDYDGCLEQCDVRRASDPEAEAAWGECVLAYTPMDVGACEEAPVVCGTGACRDPLAPYGDGGCGHY